MTTSGNVAADSTYVPRTLTPYVAWAYHEFLTQTRVNDVGTGGLADFDYGDNSGLATESANSLQLLIWKNLSPTYSSAGVLGGELDTTITDGWATNFGLSGWKGTGDVQIMQLENVRTGKSAQDQLVEIPGGGGQNPVPEANSFAVWSLLLFAAVMNLSYRRR